MFFLWIALWTWAETGGKRVYQLTPSNTKLSGFYTVERTTNFASENMFSCHVIRIIRGNIIMIYQPAAIHPAVKIIKIRIRGIDTTDVPDAANKFLKNIILRSQTILYLNPVWDLGRGQMLADVFVDGQSLADIMINNGLANESSM